MITATTNIYNFVNLVFLRSLRKKTLNALKPNVIVLQDVKMMKRTQIMVYKIKEYGVLMSVQTSSVKGWCHGKAFFV